MNRENPFLRLWNSSQFWLVSIILLLLLHFYFEKFYFTNNMILIDGEDRICFLRRCFLYEKWNLEKKMGTLSSSESTGAIPRELEPFDPCPGGGGWQWESNGSVLCSRHPLADGEGKIALSDVAEQCRWIRRIVGVVVDGYQWENPNPLRSTNIGEKQWPTLLREFTHPWFCPQGEELLIAAWDRLVSRPGSSGRKRVSFGARIICPMHRE